MNSSKETQILVMRALRVLGEEKICKELGVPRQSVWSWRTGKSKPNGGAVLHILRLLNKDKKLDTVRELITTEGGE